MITTRRYAALIASFWVAIVTLNAGCQPDVDAATRLQRANEANEVGNYDTAVTELTQLLLETPDDANARKMLGLTWLMAEDPAAAEPALKQALDLGAPIEEIRLPLTEALLLQNKTREVLELADSYPGDSNAEKAEVWFIRTATYFALSEFDDARASLDEAAALDPNSPRVALTRAAAFYASQ